LINPDRTAPYHLTAIVDHGYTNATTHPHRNWRMNQKKRRSIMNGTA